MTRRAPGWGPEVTRTTAMQTTTGPRLVYSPLCPAGDGFWSMCDPLDGRQLSSLSYRIRGVATAAGPAVTCLPALPDPVGQHVPVTSAHRGVAPSLGRKATGKVSRIPRRLSGPGSGGRGHCQTRSTTPRP